MYRWTARFLLLVMLVPAFGTVALAHSSGTMGEHCKRQRAKPAMPCHGMMMASEAPEVSEAPEASEALEASIGAVESCCPNHDCCRGMKTSEWARPAAASLITLRFVVERATAAATEIRNITDFAEQDSARAPPLSV